MKTVHCLDTYYYGRYLGYYMRHLNERETVPVTMERDEGILECGGMDYIVLNYCRTLCASYLPADGPHPVGMRVYRGNEVDFDQYGYRRGEKNENLAASEYDVQTDPMGLCVVLNDYYSRYHIPLIIMENGPGMGDELVADNQVHGPCRVDYMKGHLKARSLVIQDGVDLMGYSSWSSMDLLSSRQGSKERYGSVYVSREGTDLKDPTRIRKDSSYWCQNVTRTSGEEL